MSLEKMHSDASGVVGPKDGDSPWLNSLDEVNAIVDTFADEALRKFGNMPGADYMGWLEAECRALNSIFLGPGLTERPYDIDPAWNNPEKLGHKVMVALQLEGEDRFAVRDAFMKLADEITDLVVANQDREIEEWGWEIAALKERTAKALLALPLDDEPLSAD